MLSGLMSTQYRYKEPVVRSAFDVKRRIASNFSRAAGSYDRAATLQRQVAARVLALLPEHASVTSVLDMGTGTGSQCFALREKLPCASVVGMDMAMGMLEYARSQNRQNSQIHWCSGDIEALPFAAESFDLVCSSLAVQWCSLEGVLKEVSRTLKPGGYFVFSTLAEDSLFELDAAWRAIDEPCRVNQFDAFADQARIVKRGALTTCSFSLEPEILFYPDVFSLLRELKSLGVNTVLGGQQGLMTRSKLRSLQNAYEQYRSCDGLPLTYQVIYGVLQKHSLSKEFQQD